MNHPTLLEWRTNVLPEIVKQACLKYHESETMIAVVSHEEGQKADEHYNQTVQLCHFIERDGEGKPMEKPDINNFIFEDHPELVGNPKEYDDEAFERYQDEFEAAQKNVLFEGWTRTMPYFDAKYSVCSGKNIVDFFENGEVFFNGLPVASIDALSHASKGKLTPLTPSQSSISLLNLKP